MNYLFRNAYFLQMDDRDKHPQKQDLRVANGIICEIGSNLAPASDEILIDASEHLLMPGLVNGHFHSPGSFNKGALDDMPLELFMLYEVPPFDCPPTSTRMHYLRTILGAVEMLKHGVTAVHDDPFYVPSVTPALIDATMEAYRDAGIRATASINMPNVIEYDKYPFLYDLLPPEFRDRMRNSVTSSANELLGIYNDFIHKWHRAAEGRLRAAVSCSAPQRVTVDYLHGLNALSEKYDIPFNMHILETRLQRVLGQVNYKKSLVQYVQDQDVLNQRSHVIHAIWITEEDIDLLAASGCSIAHNPLCNLKLGSGIMPFRKLVERGINICLGSDEMCSDDAVNMWTVMKFGGLVHKITEQDYDRWPKAHEMLRCCTQNAATAMRQQGEFGALEVGAMADIILVDLQSFNFLPLNDLQRQLVFCEDGTSVRMVMVGGKIVVQNNKLLTVDEEAIKKEIRELWPAYLQQMQQVDHWARTLEPIYRKMYQQTLKEQVPVQRALIY